MVGGNKCFFHCSYRGVGLDIRRPVLRGLLGDDHVRRGHAEDGTQQREVPLTCCGRCCLLFARGILAALGGLRASCPTS